MSDGPKENHTIRWIVRRPAKFEAQHYGALVKTFEKKGMKILWSEFPQSLPANLWKKWFEKELAKETTFLFFSDKDLTWVGLLLTQIQAEGPDTAKHTPNFWIYDEVDHELLAKVPQVGIHDFFHAAENPQEILSRIELAFHRSHKKPAAEENFDTAKEQVTLQQREEFLSVCAHDLRSPLGLIQSSATLLLNSLKGTSALSPTHYELLTRINRQAGQALHLVTDLLDVMSFEQGYQPKYKLLNIHELLTEFYKDYSDTAEKKNVKFHYQNLIPTWKVFADSDRVKQMMQNLFTNALKFTESGKNIFLTVSSFQGRRKSDPPYPMMIITLRDEGAGIPKREMQRIFDRFSQIRGDSHAGGRGLGLTVARQISQLHEGNIWVESEEGKGSSFHALFPHVISQSLEGAKKASERKQPLMVVAEPSEERRELYFSAWEKWGTEVVYAKDAIEALALVFHLMPDAFVLSPDLTKMELTEVVKIVKSDVMTNALPVMIAAEESERVETRFETQLFDRIIKLPLNETGFRLTLESIGKILPVKKAA